VEGRQANDDKDCCVSESFETTIRGKVLIAAMDREPKRNALNPDITAGLDAAMNRLEDDPDLWCGILTGGPNVFSAGADLTIGPGATERGGFVGLITRRRSKPLIAAVEGYAVGGGMELVLCCDLVVASRTASFGLPEVKRGLMPDYGGAFRTANALPVNVAREMLLTGDFLPAERAERLGFVERICANAPLAVREALGVINYDLLMDEADDWERSDAAHGRLLNTADVAEGIEAFFQRRPPRWSGS
jgi:enoyl-CoA hydratase